MNSLLSDKLRAPVVKLDVIPVLLGEVLQLDILTSLGPLRRGVWVGVEGEMEINGEVDDQFVLWADTVAGEVKITVRRTDDGLLRLYNVWDSGRGRRSQTDYSGMLKSVADGGQVATYSCHDVGSEPEFDKLVFRLSSRHHRDMGHVTQPC
jgi:hypothetical protein